MAAILFLCKANICRSPAMAFAFRASIDDSMTIAVSSAGTDVRGAQPICEVSGVRIRREPKGVEFVHDHRSASVTPDGLDHQDIVIAASREERAAAALLAPGSRRSLFTLREAIRLGDDAFEPGELDRIEDVRQEEIVAAYAFLLDARRGTRNPRAEHRLFRRARSGEEQLDVRDYHHDRRGSHVRGVEDSLAEARLFADQFARGVRQVSERARRP